MVNRFTCPHVKLIHIIHTRTATADISESTDLSVIIALKGSVDLTVRRYLPSLRARR